MGRHTREVHLLERQRRLGGADRCRHSPVVGSAVLRKKPLAPTSHQHHRRDDVAEHLVGEEIVEVDPGPPGLIPHNRARSPARTRDWSPDRSPGGDARTGPRTNTRPGLDPEEVIEYRDDEVVVQVPALRPPYDEGHDGQPIRLGVAEDLDPCSSCQVVMARLTRSASRVSMTEAPTAFLSEKTSPARMDSTIAGVPASSRCSMCR